MVFIIIAACFMRAIVLIITLIEYGYRQFWRRFLNEFINRYLLYRPLLRKFRIPLEKHFKYYRSLDPKDQKLFRRRVQKFIDTKVFIPRGDLERVTPEMKVLIAATAIQVTFGYPHVYFQHFWRILVHRDTYYSQITQQFHSGEVNLRGAIILSWVSFLEGFVNDTNGKNLGYHEMAHALHFENAIQNGEYDFIGDDLLDEFHRLAIEEIDKMRNGDGKFFRDYAATNYQEFFAVVVENFFERPKELRSYHVSLYTTTSKILKQDPLENRVRLRN